MVKTDCLKPSQGGIGAAHRRRYYRLCSMLVGTLLFPAKASVEAYP